MSTVEQNFISQNFKLILTEEALNLGVQIRELFEEECKYHLSGNLENEYLMETVTQAVFYQFEDDIRAFQETQDLTDIKEGFIICGLLEISQLKGQELPVNFAIFNTKELYNNTIKFFV